jgi:hypothetical protein
VAEGVQRLRKRPVPFLVLVDNVYVRHVLRTPMSVLDKQPR